MISDLDSPPDVAIEDLWPAFLAGHPALQVPSPLTRQAYNTLAPTLGPWLMATQGLCVEIAQLALESIWSVLAGLHGALASYRLHTLCAVFWIPCARWTAPFDRAVGHHSILFAYPEVLAALAIDSDPAAILAERADVREALARCGTSRPWAGNSTWRFPWRTWSTISPPSRRCRPARRTGLSRYIGEILYARAISPL
jgi:hypothetical protein